MEKTLCLLRAVKGQWGSRGSACRRPGAGKVRAAGWPGKGGAGPELREGAAFVPGRDCPPLWREAT